MGRWYLALIIVKRKIGPTAAACVQQRKGALGDLRLGQLRRCMERIEEAKQQRHSTEYTMGCKTRRFGVTEGITVGKEEQFGEKDDERERRVVSGERSIAYLVLGVWSMELWSVVENLQVTAGLECPRLLDAPKVALAIPGCQVPQPGPSVPFVHFVRGCGSLSPITIVGLRLRQPLSAPHNAPPYIR